MKEEPVKRASIVKNGKTLLSGVDPEGRALKIVSALALRERTLYFCPSPLYGYGLSAFLSRVENETPSSAILCVECDEELFELSKNNIDISILKKPKLRLTNIQDAASLSDFIYNTWGARAFRRAEVARLSGGWQLKSDLYNSLYESVCAEIATDWGNALTLAKLGRLYIRNALRNLADISRFSPLDKLSFGKKTVLVLGAGPSLDETLDMLKNNFSEAAEFPVRRGFKIICVDTCLGALKERGIMPDLAVILESQHWNLGDFIPCNGWNVPAAADLSCLPASARVLDSGGYLFMTPWTRLRIFSRLKERGLLPPEIPPLGSVGLTAVEIARRATSGNIICSGLDFSFTADKYHCKGAPGCFLKFIRQNRFRGLVSAEAYKEKSFPVLSKSGVPAFSSPVMRHYHETFKNEFSKDERLFDVMGTGLPLDLKTLTITETFNLLSADAKPEDQKQGNDKNINNDNYKQNILSFFESELNRLNELRRYLTNEEEIDRERFSVLIEECDYLWAHFPDYAGGRQSKLSDISFLKRIRAELDPMIKLLRNIINTGE
ncbi:MAG: DUF115 domain-containing protein [Treponema sp.]|nr:DUF115 domain-containing protein [Treponema sp.]